MIRYESRDGVHVLRLDAGENRLNAGLVGALHAALDRLSVEARPLVLTGSEKFFSNGLDVDSLSDAGRSVLERVGALFARLLSFPGATAAAINGHAFGAGAMLAAACDYRFMREDRGYFCFPEVDLGVDFSPAFSALLQTKFSPAALGHAWISGQRFDASAARERGFVDAVVKAPELLDRSVAALAQLGAKNGAVVGKLKRRLYGPAIDLLAPNGSFDADASATTGAR
jgi:Delta3-Delta2-enoyl-CoA isomerase